MKVAFVSYECLPETGGGGIGTYVLEAARMLASGGHHVEVFAGADVATRTTSVDGVTIHRVASTRGEGFARQIAPIFRERHATVQFDVAESAEYNAEARYALAEAPEVARVVRVHTPTFLVRQLSFAGRQKAVFASRTIIGALRRGRLPRSWYPDKLFDLERAEALSADVITSPSSALASVLRHKWDLAPGRVVTYPNVFAPPAALAHLPPADGRRRRIGYFGRLEPRKGVFDLADAIPRVVRHVPDAEFVFVGGSAWWGHHGETMEGYLMRRVGSAAARVRLMGQVPYADVHALMASVDVCVFPSRWENFPYVCLEAMAAGRLVIGSSSGGMAEVIEDGRSGFCVPPRRPRALAAAIIEALRDPERARVMATRGRERVAELCAPAAVLPLQVRSYGQAINAAHTRLALAAA